ncbi:L-rhamnose/proton symporter RhaT [uncultured Draconibacterium sp.]|uniref:L-rhamnose/proton symporter RhaT n=1 Tax=uncultured Draconibacterium sp. TaxID=1573823 RepID=UPI0025DEE861|nr:L-rhamnose/proton symporter RhaT [uncultured Draconibacterium sp.]
MELILPFLLVVFASFFQGTFGLGMKFIKPLAWEAWWLVHAFIAMILFPMTWAFIAVPDLFSVIFSTDGAILFKAMLFGFLWGIGGILFGKSVGKVGVSLTYGIVMGLASAVGSIVPLFQIENASSQPAFPFILLGVIIIVIGVVIVAYAGIRRDKLNNADTGIPTGKAFQMGLLIAILSGVLSALLNVGFANAGPVAEAAVDAGSKTNNSSLAAWVVVLWGAFLMNALYAISLLIKNKSFHTYKGAFGTKAFRWSVLAGLFWFAALGIYGQGAALMGSIGPVIGWPMLLGLSLIISNIWAYREGEWKNVKVPFRIMLAGLTTIIIACIVLGYSNGLN